MANLSLEVVLQLVDRLTGPARDALAGLEKFGDAARQAAGADSGLRPDKWLDEGRAIDAAAQAARQFAGAATGAVDASKGVDTSWVELAGTVDKATGAVDAFKAITISAADAGKGIDTSWLTLAGDVDKATAAVRGFTEAEASAASKAPGGAGGGGRGRGGGAGAGGRGEPGAGWTMFENAGELAAMFEGPRAVEGILGGGAHLSDETIAQRIAGMDPKQIEDARALAVDLQAKFPQFPLTEILKEVREARAIFTSDDEARAALVPYMKMAALTDRDHPGEGLRAAYPALRAVEEGGYSRDSEKTVEVLDAAQRAKNAMGDKLSFTDYFEVYQRGGAFARNWDMKFIRDELPHLLASLGGDATGMMIATLGEGIMGGHLMGPSLDALDKLGLLDESKVERKGGHVKRIEPGGVQGGDILNRDPVEWAQTVLWPAIQKATSDPNAQMQLLSTVMSNRNELKAAFMAVMDAPQFARTRDLIENPLNKGLDAADQLKADPVVGWQALKSSLETLASVASEPAMAGIAKGLDVLSQGISSLSRSAAEHPVESTIASGAALAAITYWLGKGFIGVGQKLGFIEGGGAEAGAGGASWLSRIFGGAAMATGPLALGNIAAWTPPEDQKALDVAIAREKAEAAMRLSLEVRDEAAAAREDNPLSWENLRKSQGAAGALSPGFDAGKTGPLDTSSLDAAAAKAKTTGEAMKTAIEQPLNPNVNMGVLDALAAKLREITGLMGQINGFGGGAARGSAPLHDGPEAH